MGHVLSRLRSPNKAEKPTSKADVASGSSRSSMAGFSSNSKPVVQRSYGHHYYLDDGREVLDACGGAAVACLGHGNEEVLQAMNNHSRDVTYVPWAFFDNESTRHLSDWLVQSTDSMLSKVYLTSSGSEAIEAAMKLAREYFVWKGEGKRINFIAREESYHGTTVGSLSMSGHVARRAHFEEILLPNVYRVPACNAYRQKREGESDAEFVTRKAAELEEVFIKAGPETVVAFVAEPVVGAALGCMPATTGYFQAMKQVCDKYGALFILDEIMCGMGRTGVLHAWQQEGVVPDIQAVGKGLAGGYQPCSAILVNDKIVQEMQRSESTFTHGHTFQNHATASAAALKVQQIVQRDNLVSNVRVQGSHLGDLFRDRLANHPNVGDIRGRGLFWGVEFVADKTTKTPFDPNLQVARRIHDKALTAHHPMLLYHGQGCAGKGLGDHIMVMPAYTANGRLVHTIVDGVVAAIAAVFEELQV